MPETAIVKYDKPLNVPVQQVDDMRTLLVSQEDTLSAVIPSWCGVTWRRVMTTAMTCATVNPAILRCTGQSILLAVKTACEFGLSFSKPLGHAYLVPFKSSCELIMGYKGLMDLVRRAADVKVMDCGAVFEGEIFTATKGTSPALEHKIDLSQKRTKATLVATYSIAFYADKHPQFVVMDRDEIDAIRARSKAKDRGPWVTDYVAMAIKTAIRRHVNYLPISAEKAERRELLERALEHDNATAGLAVDGLAQIDPKERMAALEARIDGLAEDVPVDGPNLNVAKAQLIGNLAAVLGKTDAEAVEIIRSTAKAKLGGDGEIKTIDELAIVREACMAAVPR